MRLVQMDLTVTGLAAKIGFARNTVSMAINHPVLPTVRRRIAKALKMEVAK
jgi:plasmid maintenance system antidote protein VapI